MRTQVVESGGHERHDEEGVGQQPGHQQQLLRVGQQQTHTQHQVGGEAHPVHLQHAVPLTGSPANMSEIFDDVVSGGNNTWRRHPIHSP